VLSYRAQRFGEEDPVVRGPVSDRSDRLQCGFVLSHVLIAHAFQPANGIGGIHGPDDGQGFFRVAEASQGPGYLKKGIAILWKLRHEGGDYGIGCIRIRYNLQKGEAFDPDEGIAAGCRYLLDFENGVALPLLR